MKTIIFSILIAILSLGTMQHIYAQCGIITTVAGNGTPGYIGDGGQATAAELFEDGDVAIQPFSGDGVAGIYITDWGNSVVRFMSTTGVISTFAGNGSFGFGGDGGQATDASINQPAGITVDALGNVYISDSRNNRIRKVNTAGIITTIAGNGIAGFYGDGGQATDAMINYPTYVKVDASGNVYFSDPFNSRLRKINSSGIISTIAGGGSFTGDGIPATMASFYWLGEFAIDTSMNIYLVDETDEKVRKINASGIITTIAGNGVMGYSGDGEQATNATLNQPLGLAIDAYGSIFFSENSNNVIRKINPAGIITTVVGNNIPDYSGDNGPATDASINGPQGIAFDAGNNLYIADLNNNRVRKVQICEDVSEVQHTVINEAYIKVYPNPTSTIINFQYSMSSDANLIITDVAGREIATLPLVLYQHSQSINCRAWAKGLYFYKVVEDSGLGSIGKLIVE